MSMKALNELRDMFCDELEEIARKPEMSAGDLDTVHKLTDTVKNIDKICMMDESCDYSMAGDWEMAGRGRYERGNSYARSRDAKGRYTGRYSRADAKESMVERLEDMLDDARGDKERSAIRRCIDQIGRA